MQFCFNISEGASVTCSNKNALGIAEVIHEMISTATLNSNCYMKYSISNSLPLSNWRRNQGTAYFFYFCHNHASSSADCWKAPVIFQVHYCFFFYPYFKWFLLAIRIIIVFNIKKNKIKSPACESVFEMGNGGKWPSTALVLICCRDRVGLVGSQGWLLPSKRQMAEMFFFVGKWFVLV